MANTPDIAQDVIEAVKAHLKDDDNGFNARIETIALARNLDRFEIDFEGHAGNFFEMHVTPEILIRSGLRNWPTMTLFLGAGQNQNRVMRHHFSGVVQVGIDVFLSDDRSEPVFDFESKTRLIVDALVATFNDLSAPRLYATNMGYNNEISWTPRVATDRQGENWLQVIEFRLNFSIDVQ